MADKKELQETGTCSGIMSTYNTLENPGQRVRRDFESAGRPTFTAASRYLALLGFLVEALDKEHHLSRMRLSDPPLSLLFTHMETWSWSVHQQEDCGAHSAALSLWPVRSGCSVRTCCNAATAGSRRYSRSGARDRRRDPPVSGRTG